MEQLASYQNVLAEIGGQKCHLLVGNGFSIAYDEKFSYKSLYDKSLGGIGEATREVFEVINNPNIENILHQIDTTKEIIKIISKDPELISKLGEINDQIKTQLLRSIAILHPEQVYNIGEKEVSACADFLKPYLSSQGHIFSTNYDLLLYWVLMRRSSGLKVSDGFGTKGGALLWGPNKDKQNIHYLHGAMPFFLKDGNLIKECYQEGGPHLLKLITGNINAGSYPLCITEGNSGDKMRHINNIDYLRFCRKQLSSITNSLVTFGVSFSPSDQHIVDALKENKSLNKIYVGVYDRDEMPLLKKQMGQMAETDIMYYDAKSIKVWE